MQRHPLPISVRGQEGAPILPQYPTRARGQPIMRAGHQQARGAVVQRAQPSPSQPSKDTRGTVSQARGSGRGRGSGSGSDMALDYARTQSREREMMREYRAQIPDVDLRGYLMNTLSGMQDEDVTLNPQGIGIVVDPFSGGTGSTDIAPAPGGDTSSIENDIAAIAAKIAIGGPIPVDPAMPVGHVSIDDTRLYFDSLITSTALNGYASGDVAIRFSEHNGLTTPTRVVKITIGRFYFPHIYLANNTVFDLFYHRSVFLTLSVVPTTHLVQTATPNALFTFELHVADIDSNALLLEPIEPTFCLKQAITISGDIIAQFRVRSTRGLGFVPCPIPPIQVVATRVATDAVSTTFDLGALYIGVLAPPGATYTVPIYIRRPVTVPLPSDPFVTFIVNDTVGYQSSTFTITNRFSIPVSSLAFPVLATDQVIIFIPKNSFSLMVRFSSAQTSVTNGLFPVHS